MFDTAMKTARTLDEHYEKYGTLKGPLHGLPISLKDQFHVKGYDTTMGYVGWIGTYEGHHDIKKVRNVNSQIVGELLSLGAVLYCKVRTLLPHHSTHAEILIQTSLPQTLLVSFLVLRLSVFGNVPPED